MLSLPRTATEMGAITELGRLEGRLGLVGACLIHPSLIHHLEHHYVTDVDIDDNDNGKVVEC